ncbi:hypothetical protein SDC9_95380 [bioreactor metagenome]|uniref:Uncharacterized protein n=1 Tax=bioreactor metagenome TaxID=1076179 RepID=A0A645AG75_9ZZZZ
MLVADAQHTGRQLSLVSVQSLNGLALPGGADDDFSALHTGEVEGVHGLAVFQHDVVGDIHDVVDGADAGITQPFPHPGGGRLDFHVFHHPGGVPGTKIRILDLNVHQLRDAVAAALDLRGVELEGLAEGGGGLPGEADDTETVRPVGRDLKLHDVIVITDELGNVVAGLHVVLVEDPDAVGDAVGELGLLGVKISKSAYAIFTGVIGHQIALMEVLTVGGGVGGALTVV